MPNLDEIEWTRRHIKFQQLWRTFPSQSIDNTTLFTPWYIVQYYRAIISFTKSKESDRMEIDVGCIPRHLNIENLNWNFHSSHCSFCLIVYWYTSLPFKYWQLAFFALLNSQLCPGLFVYTERIWYLWNNSTVRCTFLYCFKNT